MKKSNLTAAQRRILIHARAKGQVFPYPSSNAGGAVRRCAKELAARGLLEKDAPYAITKDGRAAIENYDNAGRKMSRFYLVPYDEEIAARRESVLAGIEMKAFLKTGGDTVGMVIFRTSTLELWRGGRLVEGGLCAIGDVYRVAEKRGRNW